MAAQALYRKWRSQTFDEVVGQGHVTQTLRNALRDGRIAHAYLFAGPRGTGKTTTARLLAKAVNCLSEDEDKPCNQCAICLAVNEGRLLDLIEIDAASYTGVDNVRDVIVEKVGFRPTEARYKVYIVDEVHMLSKSAFNALLKTLEEPPPHVIFVLATTEPHKVPATVLSRCQRFDFKRIPLADITGWLEHISDGEGVTVEPAALELIARSATGSMRDAISLLDQLASHGGAEVTLEQVQAMLGTVDSQTVSELVEHVLARDVADGLALINRVVADGTDPRQFNRQVVDYLRGLLLIKVGNGAGLINVTAEGLQTMTEQTSRMSSREWMRVVRLFNQAGLDLKGSTHPQLPLELAFLDAVVPEEVAVPAKARPASPPGPRSRANPPPANQSPRPAADESPSRQITGKTEASPPDTVEPAGQPPPVASPGPGSGVTVEAVRLNWARILAEMRSRSLMTIEALLRSCDPMEVDGEVVVLRIPFPFHKDKLEEPKNKAVVERVISQVMGRPCRMRCVLLPKSSVKQPAPKPAMVPAPVASPPAAPPARRASGTPGRVSEDEYRAAANDPLIREAVSRYGAQVVDIR